MVSWPHQAALSGLRFMSVQRDLQKALAVARTPFCTGLHFRLERSSSVVQMHSIASRYLREGNIVVKMVLRHVLPCPAIACTIASSRHAHLYWCAGKFYTLATGSNERRWNKMKPRLEQVVQSFEVQNRYDAAPIG